MDYFRVLHYFDFDFVLFHLFSLILTKPKKDFELHFITKDYLFIWGFLKLMIFLEYQILLFIYTWDKFSLLLLKSMFLNMNNEKCVRKIFFFLFSFHWDKLNRSCLFLGGLIQWYLWVFWVYLLWWKNLWNF
jgi:hypothetical protein